MKISLLNSTPHHPQPTTHNPSLEVFRFRCTNFHFSLFNWQQKRRWQRMSWKIKVGKLLASTHSILAQTAAAANIRKMSFPLEGKTFRSLRRKEWHKSYEWMHKQKHKWMDEFHINEQPPTVGAAFFLDPAACPCALLLLFIRSLLGPLLITKEAKKKVWERKLKIVENII